MSTKEEPYVEEKKLQLSSGYLDWLDSKARIAEATRLLGLAEMAPFVQSTGGFSAAALQSRLRKQAAELTKNITLAPTIEISLGTTPSWPCATFSNPLRRCKCDVFVIFEHSEIKQVENAVRECHDTAIQVVVASVILSTVAGAGGVCSSLASALNTYSLSFGGCCLAKGIQFAFEIGIQFECRNRREA